MHNLCFIKWEGISYRFYVEGNVPSYGSLSITHINPSDEYQHNFFVMRGELFSIESGSLNTMFLI